MSKSLEELRELADREVSGSGSAGSSEADDADSASGSRSDSGRRARLGRSPVTPKGLLLTFLAAGAGLLVGGAIPLLGGLLQYAGLFAATFLLGVVRSRRAYVETAIGGAAASVLLFAVNTFTSVNLFIGADLLAEYGAAVAGVGLTAGAIMSIVGYYFGRDLRDGFTRDV